MATQAAQDHRAQAAVEFGAGALGQHQGQQPEQAGGGAHEDGADPGTYRVQHRLQSLLALVAHVVQGLVDDQDRVVDDDPCQEDKT